MAAFAGFTLSKVSDSNPPFIHKYTYKETPFIHSPMMVLKKMMMMDDTMAFFLLGDIYINIYIYIMIPSVVPLVSVSKQPR